MLMNVSEALVSTPCMMVREENEQISNGKVVYYVELCAFMGPIKRCNGIN